jgi:hypothetical protein
VVYFSTIQPVAQLHAVKWRGKKLKVVFNINYVITEKEKEIEKVGICEIVIFSVLIKCQLEFADHWLINVVTTNQTYCDSIVYY